MSFAAARDLDHPLATLTKLTTSGVIMDSEQMYRYALLRMIEPSKRGPEADNTMVIVMLNPSTADATLDDPTIRRCMNFAKREGKSFLVVVNLFALRSTDPKKLLYSSFPTGPLNNQVIGNLVIALFGRTANFSLVAAWGSGNWDNKEFNMLCAIDSLTVHLRDKLGLQWQWKCLGTSKYGQPHHPLYLKSDTKLENWYDPRSR